MPTVRTALHIGRRHLIDGMNRQDALRVVEGEDYVIGVICDGCSEGKYSEVGANLGAEFLCKHLERWMWLKCKYKDVGPVWLSTTVQRSLDRYLRDLIVYEEHLVDFVHDHLLFTVIGFIWTPAETAVFYQGDGTLWINDECQHLNVGQTPMYPAYRLIPDALPQGFVVPDFTIGRYENVKRIAIGSDAWKDEPDLANEVLNSVHPQRQINVWSDREHRFQDDVSIITLEVE